MPRYLSFASLLAPALALTGCATSIAPIAVTRFYLGGDVGRGTVAPVSEPSLSLERATYQQAVIRGLAHAGFTPVGDAANARYVFTTDVTRDARDAGPRRSPVTIGVGGGTGGGGYYGGGSSVGIGASFGLGGNRAREIVVTRLSVQLRERGGSTVWEGRAETEAPSNTPGAQPGLAADKLASALFAGFPGVSGRTIMVR